MFSVVQDYEKENPNFLEKVSNAKVFLSVSQRAKMALIHKKRRLKNSSDMSLL